MMLNRIVPISFIKHIPIEYGTWGLDASGSTSGAGGVGGLLMVDDSTNGVHFVSYDLNGNVAGLVNATNGTVSATYEYGPFGEQLSSTGTMAASNPFRFSTKYTDTESDLVYYGYRYYSPSLGRWISRDPIEEQGGLKNLYGFVSNDPVNRWDKLGMHGIPPGMGISIPTHPPHIPQSEEFKKALVSYTASCIDEGAANEFYCLEISNALYGNISSLLQAVRK